MPSRNPYSPNGHVPPDDFIGRKAEIATAFDQIANRGHVAVWGEPKIGKSSFLKKLAFPPVWHEQGLDPSKAVVVLLTCLVIHPFTAAGFWREVLNILQHQLENDAGLQTEVTALLEQGQANRDGFGRILQKLGQQGKFLVLLVDDYDAALHPHVQYTEADIEAFVNECRSFTLSYGKSQYFSMIVSSTRRLDEFGTTISSSNGSPWFNHYLFLPLKPFTEPEINDLLKAMTPNLRQGIQRLTGRNPALLQLSAYLLYQERELRTGNLPDAEALARQFESMTRQIFEIAWKRSSADAQTLLMLIALSELKGRIPGRQFDLSGLDIVFSQKERELRSLEDRGLIVSTKEGSLKKYAFDSAIMERWAIQELLNSDDEQLQKRQKVLLGINQQQADKVTAAARWLWSHKDQVPSIIKLAVDATDLLP
jgi:phosphatidylethanolamine-binding protein (PEBP) family uncharacterized protein